MTPIRCTYCGDNGHPTSLCPKTSAGSSNRFSLRCGYCGSKLHAIAYCPKTATGNANRRENPNGHLPGREDPMTPGERMNAYRNPTPPRSTSWRDIGHDLAFKWAWWKQDLARWLDKRAMDVAWALPHWLVKWATIRCWGHATTGQWGHEEAPGVTVTTAVQRWEIPHRELTLDERNDPRMRVP